MYNDAIFQLKRSPETLCSLGCLAAFHSHAGALRSPRYCPFMEEVMHKEATMGVIVMVAVFVIGAAVPFLLKAMGAWT